MNSLSPETEARHLHAAAMACEAAAEHLNHARVINTPSQIYRPTLSIDGNQWCALYGADLQEGVAGFGESPQKAYEDFDREWAKALPA